MARKRKIFYEITPKILKKVELLASKGCHVKDIAVSIGWGKTYFYEQLNGKKGKKPKSTDLADALERGQAKRIVTLISNLAKRADGYKYKEIHTEDIVDKETGKIDKQKVRTITRHMPADVGAIEYSLNNLDGANWASKQDHNIKGDIIIKTDKDDDKL